MKKETEYSKKLRDPRWQKKRLQIFQRDEFQCRLCGEESKELQVHHRKYPYGLDPWEADDFDLVTLCRECHQRINNAINQVRDGCVWEAYIDALELFDDLMRTDDWTSAYATLSGLHKYFIRKPSNENRASDAA